MNPTSTLAPHSGLCPGNQLSTIHTDAFSQPDQNGRTHLLGCRCEDCAFLSFPPRMSCGACYSTRLHQEQLPSLGTLKTFTVVYMAPPGYYGPVPYVIGLVTLDTVEIDVLADLVDKQVDQWTAGERVEACVRPLPLGTGNDCAQAFAFRPFEESNHE